jgi:hypothetical protein
MYERAVDVRWEVHPSEASALAREADLLVAVPPPWNAAGAWGGWSDVVVGAAPRRSGRGRDGRVALHARRTDSGTVAGRRYGCFPHLGPGLATVSGTACTDGFAALQRLWDASPPAPELERPLHDLLTGTSRRLLDELMARAAEAAEAYRRPALARDRLAAEGFFLHGPARLRSLRLRQGLGTGYVAREAFCAAIEAEVRGLLGEDVVLLPAPDPSLLGRRAARSPRHTTRS